MFDGSYRTQQRVVNLGSTNAGRKRNKTLKDRTAILEQTRLLREQRHNLQKQVKACIAIQRRVRGNYVRYSVAKQWQNQIIQLISSFVKSNDTSDENRNNSKKITLMFNAWLRLKLHPSNCMMRSSSAVSQLQCLSSGERSSDIQELLHLYSTFLQTHKNLFHSMDSTWSSTREPTEYLHPHSSFIVQATLEQIQKQYQPYSNIMSHSTNGNVNDSIRLSDNDMIQILSYALAIQPVDHLEAFASNYTFGSTNGTNGNSAILESNIKPPDRRMCECIVLLLIETYCIVFERCDLPMPQVSVPLNPTQSLLAFLYHCVSVYLSILDDTVCYRALRGAISLIEPSTVTGYKKEKHPCRTMLQQFLPDILHVLRPNRRTINESIPSYNDKFRNVAVPRDVFAVVQRLIGQCGIRTLQRYIMDDIIPLSEDLYRDHVSTKDEKKHTNSNQLYDFAMWMQYMKYVLIDDAFDATTIKLGQRQDNIESKLYTNRRLLWMIQCVVRGDNIRKPSTPSKEKLSSSSVDDSNDDDSTDNDDDDAGVVHSTLAALGSHWSLNNDVVAPPVNVTSAVNTTTNRMTKMELQTVPKLDRLYADLIRRVDQVFTSKFSLNSHPQADERNDMTEDYLISLATQFADATLWLKWGILLLSTIDDDEDDFILRGRDMEFLTMLRYGQDDYISLCVILLQATTGLRSQQNATASSVLNTFAFSSSFLQFLWKYIQRQCSVTDFLRLHIGTPKNVFFSPQSFLSLSTANEGLYYSLVLFSDVFAHHLIVINDENFLSSYTTLRSPLTRSKPFILIEDIIQHFKTVLYELYWTKPVGKTDLRLILGTGVSIFMSSTISQLVAKSDEDCLASIRARLLLTGTKLWNSIYERWCRLYSYARFCNESIWWFPNVSASSSFINDALVSNDNASSTDRPVYQQRRNARRSLGDANDDPMDIDNSSSSEDEMDTTTSNVDGESDRLAAIFLDPKMARVLASIPQALPFDHRVKIFDSLLRADKAQSQNESLELRQIMLAMMGDNETTEIPGRETVHVRRNELYSDSMDQLNKLGPKLKRRVQVTFTNQHGTQEAGIDGGGVFKEFIDDLIKDAFSVDSSAQSPCLFAATPFQTLTVNTYLLDDLDLLPHYEFLGRVLGKAVYESILVEPQFCLPFLNQLLGKSNSIEDLKNLDLEYYNNLTKLFDMSASEIKSMELSFEMTLMSGSSACTIELIPDGRNIPVTKTNVIQYVHLVSHQRLNVLTARQTRAFLCGFRDLIPASWVRLFSAYELQKLISGDDSVQGIDVASLKKAMQYAAGYHPDQPVIKTFWEIIEEMTPDQQRKFLKFMTSCSRQPLLGFGSLEPAPCIQQIRLPDSLFDSSDNEKIIKEAPLPTSSTCMNLFKLPNYRGKELMRQKILVAIESGAGFELT